MDRSAVKRYYALFPDGASAVEAEAAIKRLLALIEADGLTPDLVKLIRSDRALDAVRDVYVSALVFQGRLDTEK